MAQRPKSTKAYKPRNELPSLNNSTLTFPTNLFMMQYFKDTLYHGTGDLSTYKFFQNMMANTSSQYKYIALWLELGNEIQVALEILNTTRQLRVKGFVDKVKFRAHNLAKYDIIPLENIYRANRNEDDMLSDKDFLTWSEILNDLLFAASEHLQHFINEIKISNLPSYEDIGSKSSTQE